MKAYFNNETGSGKTLSATLFALFFAEMNPELKIYSNYHINLFNKETRECINVYTSSCLLPFSEVKKGNCLIIFDDFYAIKNADFYSGMLAVLSRKTQMDILLTIQYYTDIKKRVRELCHYEITPTVSNLDIFGKLTDKSTLNLSFYHPRTLDFLFCTAFYNVKHFLDNIKKFEFYNIFCEYPLYNTDEVPEFLTESKKIDEVAKFSNNFYDIEMNCGIIERAEGKRNRLIDKVCKKKGVKNKLK